MRKRAGFARALVLDPDIVLFDEPDSGLDPVRTALLCELIQEIHEENGGAYVVITHDIMSAQAAWPSTSPCCGRAGSSSPARPRSSSTPTTSSCASSCRVPRRARSGWNSVSLGANRSSRSTDSRAPDGACAVLCTGSQDAGRGEKQSWRRWPHDAERDRPQRAGRAVGARPRRRARGLPAALPRRGRATSTRCVFQNAGPARQGQRRAGRRPARSARSLDRARPTTTRPRSRSRSRSPTRRCARARRPSIRLTSLSGIANRYVALTPGARHAPSSSTTARARRRRRPSVVDLDQLFNTLDAKTRGGLQDVIQGFATQYDGKGEEAGEAAKYFNPLLSTHARARQPSSPRTRRRSTRFLVDSVARRDRASPSAATTSPRSSATRTRPPARSPTRTWRSTRALELLPTHAAPANTTFVNLRATLDDLDALVAESKPATQGARARSCASCARSCTTRGRRSATCARSSAAPGPTTT